MRVEQTVGLLAVPHKCPCRGRKVYEKDVGGCGWLCRQGMGVCVLLPLFWYRVSLVVGVACMLHSTSRVVLLPGPQRMRRLKWTSCWIHPAAAAQPHRGI